MNEQEFLRKANPRELEMYARMLKADHERAIRRWWAFAGVLALLVLLLAWYTCGH